MKNTQIPRNLTEWKPEDRRSVGRPRLRWMDGVEESIRKMKIKSGQLPGTESCEGRF
jgi:hypothetical protein